MSLYLQREIGLSTFLGAIQTFCLKVGHYHSASDSILQAIVYLQRHSPGDVCLLFCRCIFLIAVNVWSAQLLLLWLIVPSLIGEMHKVGRSWFTK